MLKVTALRVTALRNVIGREARPKQSSGYEEQCLASQEPDGTPVDADTDSNDKVSVAEAFEYARKADTADEIPQIESNGNGFPSSTVNSESGNYASTFFLK